MPRQERIKTVVIANRSDFRTSIVSFLNQAGFAAEKKMVGELVEIEPLLNDDLVWNFILDLHDSPKAEWHGTIKKLNEMINDSRIHPLVYLDENSTEDAEALRKEFPNTFVVTKPISRQHIANALVKPFMARHGHMKKVKKNDNNENTLIIEAIMHVKDTIESLKKVAADRSMISEVTIIGQKFNGIYGTFKFFESYPGYSELVKMAEIIDSVAVTYSIGIQDESLTKEHLELVIASAKTAFNLLKMMRDGDSPDEVMFKRCQNIYDKFLATPELKKRNTTSQGEVDDLLSKMGF